MNGLTRDIPPEFGGIVQEPNRNDVLSGRGGRINSHPGNVYFRNLVNQYKFQYLANDTAKLDKAKIADIIVRNIRNLNPPGRFLKEVPKATHYLEIGDEKARKKAGQAMREKSQTTRKLNEEHQLRHPQPVTSMFHPATGTPFTYQGLYRNQEPHVQGYPGAEQTYPSYLTSSTSLASPVPSLSSPPIASTSTAPSFTPPSTQNPRPYQNPQSPQSPYPDTSISQQYNQSFPEPHLHYGPKNNQESTQKEAAPSIPTVHGAAFDRQFEPLRSSEESSNSIHNSLRTIPTRDSMSSGLTLNSSLRTYTSSSSSSNPSLDLKMSAGSTEPILMESVRENDNEEISAEGDDVSSHNRPKYLPDQLNPEGDTFNKAGNKLYTLTSVTGTYSLKRTHSDPVMSGSSMRLINDPGRDDSMGDFLDTAGFGQNYISSQEITDVSTSAVVSSVKNQSSSTSPGDRPPRFKMERAASAISDYSMGSAVSRSNHSSGTCSWLNNIPYDTKLLEESSRSMMSEMSADLHALDLAENPFSNNY